MVNISAKAEMMGSKTFQHAVVVHSDHAISVQALNTKPDTAELTLLRPTPALGTEYFVLTPPGTSARNVKEFAVVAGAAGASVSVKLKGSVTFNGKFYPAGGVLSVTLQPYNVAQLQSTVDLSGSKVTASSPVAVLSGHSCAQKHTTCNHVVEQLLPTSAWGTHYVVPTLASQSRYDLAYVVASQATKLTYNHGGTAGSRGLQEGDVVEFEVRPSRPLYLSADVGIQVLLFGTGAIRNEVTYDPFLVLIPSVAAYCPANVVKSVPGIEGVALVVAQTKATSELTIDGQAMGANLAWAAVPGSEFSYAEVELGTADVVHVAQATTNFGMLTFGLTKAVGYATAADCSQTVLAPVEPSCEGVKCPARQRCKVVDGKAKCVAESPAVCRAQGDPHYTTFDGRRYDMMGTCSYTMAELCSEDDTLPAFSVEAKNEHRGSRRVSYVGLVTVRAYSHSVSLTRGEVGFVLIDSQRSRLPVSLSEGRLRVYQSGPRAVVELVFGLVVTYDWDCQLALSLPTRFQDQVCGLCGNYNGDPADDFFMPDGDQAADPVEFASSWKLDDGDYLCEDGCQNNCPTCTPGQAQHYEGDRLCGMLTKLDGPFAVCHDTLDPRPFLEQCVYDLCVVGGDRPSLCRGLSAYAQACLELDISVGDWRPPANCPLTCPANSRYELCGPACPASCNGAAAPSNCSGRPCVEGCVCLPGFVASGGACVPASSCGCTFQGLLLAPGQEVWADELCQRRCTCNGTTTQQVTCRDTKGCPAGERCSVQNGLLGCYPDRFGTCQGSGDPHYVSFDGRRFDFMGTCTYLLVGSCGQNAALPAFRVLVENEHRGSQTVSYTRAVRVEARGVKVAVRREYPGQVLVDGVLQYLPFQAADGQVQVFRQGRDAVVRTDFGLTVTYNWDARVTAKVPSSYAEALCGLCGNFNGDPADDLALRGGGQAANALAFGNSWQEETRPGCGATEPGDCPKLDSLVTQQLQSKKECGILADPEGPFRECHSKLDPQGAVRDCVYDRCLLPGQSGPLCDALATYTAACQAAGATVHPWRSEELCPLSCPPHSHYEVCSYGCPLSCGDLPVPGGCGSECHEGCVCDEGFALSGESCVPLASCGCIHQGTYHPPGQTFYPGPGCDSLCHCQEGGLVSCEPSTCGPHEACQLSGGSLGCVAVGSATCQASGDPHYTTFDGRRFDFMGTCVYVLAQTCGTTRPGLHSLTRAVFPLRASPDPDSNTYLAYAHLVPTAFQCPAHSHYELCGDSCPVSCPSLSAPEGCESACREGCVCDAGFVLSGDSCVPVGQCGCLHNGRYYPLGQAFYPGPECERRCECGPRGHVTCQEGSACGPHEECRLEDGVQACHATGCGRCLASGGIHYITLDGRVYDLHGSCSYILAQVCRPKPGDEDFSIVLEKNAAGDPQRLLVTVAGQVVSLARGLQVTVDGEAVALPVAVGHVRVTAEGRNVVLQTTKGLRLLFDGDAHILMSIPSPFRGRLCGLCGNFNGNWSDDFVLPSGVAASSVETFGAAWRAPGSSQGCGEGCGPQGCPVCLAEETAPYEGNEACGQLRDPQGPFATCQAVLSPSEYFRQCVYDLCAQKGDKAFLCRSLAAYTAACQAAGVAVKPWRTDSFCPLQCPAHSHYSVCTRTCQGSCAALSGLTGCTTHCFEGCECDNRYLLSQGVCIPVQDCGCTHNGRYLPVNSSLLTSDCSERCSCSPSSGLTCQAAGCPPGHICEVQAEARDCWAPRGLCFLSVGANLTTFDGAHGAITSPGVYELSSRCPGLEKTIPWYRVVADVQTCHGKAEAVSQVHIFFQDGMVTVTPNKGVWVNGLRVDLPAEKLASVSVSRTPDGSLLVRQEAGVQVWLGADGKLAVMVSNDHAGKLCGACGNFDGDQTNDGYNSEQKPAVEKWRAQDFSPCYD
ncbi:IgGFc-binding protein [Sapajus apella]|uniref:IgGFc-binding protein n=1 Tax=Sapajus apella TaxID=9515 RepID=A0A6J3FIB4_SAPAP|nr:IgGFc-binding protein [Sapajus apella]